jgi:hypothetical protein
MRPPARLTHPDCDLDRTAARPWTRRGGVVLRRILTEHTPDDAKQQLAERILKHLERLRFELDEDGQALFRKRPPLSPHGMPGGE